MNDNRVGKNNNNKIVINPFLFLLNFCLVSSSHSHNLNLKCYIDFYSKEESKHYTKIKFCLFK